MVLSQIVYQGKTKKGDEIIIRYPLASDLNQLFLYINKLSKEKVAITFQGERIKSREEKNYLDLHLKKIKKNEEVKLLAFSGKQLIGIVDIIMQEKIESHVGVFGLTIAKEYRNQGIGKLLLQLVLEEASKNLPQLKIVKLGVFECNDIAFNLYEQFGFKEYGRLPKGVKHQGIYIDHIYMYKRLGGF